MINGGQWFTKDFTVDGSTGTGDIPGNSMKSGPSMEAVQELQAQTSGLDAQSSITCGGVIAMNLKSGTGGAPMTGRIARMVVQSFGRLGASKKETENLTPRELGSLNCWPKATSARKSPRS